MSNMYVRELELGGQNPRDGVGLVDRTGIPEETRLGRGVLPTTSRTAGVRVPVCRALAGSPRQTIRPRPAAADQAPGAVGDLSGQGSQRPRLRSAQARATQ